MKKEVHDFIKEYYELFNSVGLILDYKLYDYNEAYNNNGDFIDYDNNLYRYGGCERGVCEILFKSPSLLDCMYFPVRAEIHNISFNYELQSRFKNLDPRILGFGMMLYYMNKFHNNEWNKKLHLELFSIIEEDKLQKIMILKIAELGQLP